MTQQPAIARQDPTTDSSTGSRVEQATIGARVDGATDIAVPAAQHGWWAVTDDGVRRFVPEATLRGPANAANPDADRGLRALRSGQRVELVWRTAEDGEVLTAVRLPLTQPTPDADR